MWSGNRQGISFFWGKMGNCLFFGQFSLMANSAPVRSSCDGCEIHRNGLSQFLHLKDQEDFGFAVKTFIPNRYDNGNLYPLRRPSSTHAFSLSFGPPVASHSSTCISVSPSKDSTTSVNTLATLAFFRSRKAACLAELLLGFATGGRPRLAGMPGSGRLGGSTSVLGCLRRGHLSQETRKSVNKRRALKYLFVSQKKTASLTI